MASVQEIENLNRALADKLVNEAKRDPQSAYMGKVVGIANGQIVVVADDLSTVLRQLNQAEPDIRKTFCLAVGPDYDKVVEIWEVHADDLFVVGVATPRSASTASLVSAS